MGLPRQGTEVGWAHSGQRPSPGALLSARQHCWHGWLALDLQAQDMTWDLTLEQETKEVTHEWTLKQDALDITQDLIQERETWEMTWNWTLYQETQ